MNKLVEIHLDFQKLNPPSTILTGKYQISTTGKDYKIFEMNNKSITLNILQQDVKKLSQEKTSNTINNNCLSKTTLCFCEKLKFFIKTTKSF